MNNLTKGSSLFIRTFLKINIVVLLILATAFFSCKKNETIEGNLIDETTGKAFNPFKDAKVEIASEVFGGDARCFCQYKHVATVSVDENGHYTFIGKVRSRKTIHLNVTGCDEWTSGGVGLSTSGSTITHDFTVTCGAKLSRSINNQSNFSHDSVVLYVSNSKGIQKKYMDQYQNSPSVVILATNEKNYISHYVYSFGNVWAKKMDTIFAACRTNYEDVFTY